MTDFSFAMFKNEGCQTDGALIHFWNQHSMGEKNKTKAKQPLTFGQNITGQSFKAENKKRDKSTL